MFGLNSATPRYLAALLLMITTTGCIPAALDETRHTPPCPNAEWLPARYAPKPCVDDDRINPDDVCDPFNPFSLIDVALRNSPQTQNTWRTARATAYDVGVAKSALYPYIEASETVNATTSHGGGSTGGSFSGGLSGAFGTSGSRGSGNVEFVTLDLSLTYLLLDFGGRCETIRGAYEALHASNWTHNRMVQTVIVTTLEAYYNYQLYVGLIEARTQDLKDAVQNREAAKQQFETGISTVVDLLQAEANEVNAKLQLVTAEGQANIALGQLSTAIGWPAYACLTVGALPEDLPIEDISADMCYLVDIAKSVRPDLAAAYAAYVQAKANIGVQISAALPTISLAGDASRTHYFGNNSALNGSAQRAAISLNMPVFSGWLYENQIAGARESAAAAFATWRSTELSVLLDVVTAYYTYSTAVEGLAYSNQYLEFATKAYDAAFENYKQGAGSWLQVLTAQIALSDARARIVQARTSLLTAAAQIAYSVGTM